MQKVSMFVDHPSNVDSAHPIPASAKAKKKANEQNTEKIVLA